MGNNSVKLDEQTKQILLDLIQLRDEAQARIRLVLQIYINAKGLQGNWTLSQDCSELQEVVKTEEVS